MNNTFQTPEDIDRFLDSCEEMELGAVIMALRTWPQEQRERLAQMILHSKPKKKRKRERNR
jgi:hypothetical protein